MPSLVGYKSQKISDTLPQTPMRSLKEHLIRICQMLCFQVAGTQDAFARNSPTSPRTTTRKTTKKTRNAKPGKRKNCIFKGPLTYSLTNEILCFFITAGFPMVPGIGHQWRRDFRQCRPYISARMTEEPTRLYNSYRSPTTC